MDSVYFARQPILDMNNETYGYELLYREDPNRNEYTGGNGDISTADVINSAFFADEPEAVLSGKKAFINFTGNLIKKGVPKMISPEYLVIEILESVVPDPNIILQCIELKKLGYIIALDDYVYSDDTRRLFALADIIKLDLRGDREKVEATAAIGRQNDKILLAEKVETETDVMYAKRLGCTYMQGYFFAKPILVSQKSNAPMAKTFFQILGMVYQPEPDYDEIASVISTDAVLTVRLLRLLNIMCAGTGNKISTVHQALVLLGFDKLKEWVYLVGLQRLKKDTPDELIKMALFRAKLCESISVITPGAYPYRKELYLMGLMSLIVSTTNKFSGKNIIDDLFVSDKIKSGLLGEEGLYGDVYRLVVAYEKAEWDKVDEFTAKYDVDSELLANEYMKCLKFIQQFYIDL